MELYKDETCIGKTVFITIGALRRAAERGPGSVYHVPCLYPLGFATNVIRKLENAGLDFLL